MTTEYAKEILLEAAQTMEKNNTLRAAIEMSVMALDAWDKYQDIECDYNQQAKMLKELITHYRQPVKPDFVNGTWVCPSCGERIGSWHTYCHACGKYVGWDVNARKNILKAGRKKKQKGRAR